MKVVVCGAGQVGTTIARHLAFEGANVTVIDNDVEQARRAAESFDVTSVVGHASHPAILEQAGAQDADMLIAVTRSDEVNMVACQVAYSLFSVKRRVARVRHNGYLAPIWKNLYGSDQLPIDVIISPELEVANGIMQRLRTPGAFDVVALADRRVQLLGIHCNTGTCGAYGLRIRDLPERFPSAPMVVLALVREGRAFVPAGDEVIKRGDDVFVVTTPAALAGVMDAFGHKEKIAYRIVIVGGGNVGLNLAQQIRSRSSATSLKVIEASRSRAEFVARELGSSVVVLQGDALDREVLDEANVADAETLVAVTNDDETNIFASVLAKRSGCERAITLVNKSSYEPLMPSLGIDVVVSPSAITISSILRHVRHRSVLALHTLREGFGEVIEALAQPDSRLVSGNLQEIGVPEGVRVGAVVRNGEVILPNRHTRIEPGDRVVALVTYTALKAAEDLLDMKARRAGWMRRF